MSLLLSRGLRIEKPEAALTTLRRINYYRLSAYWHPFKLDNDTFQPDGSFEKAAEFYEFDRELRLAVINMLERIEVGFRCAISYHLSHAHGPYSHEDSSFFDRRFDHTKWVVELHRETDRSKEAFVGHFREDYAEYPSLPLWVAAEVMSFGTLSLLYFGLNSTDRASLAKPYNVHHVVFASWLHSLAYVRNICAHHSRLWNRDLSIAPKMPYQKDWRPPEIPNPKKVYAVLCILRGLSSNEQCGDAWARQIVELMKRYDTEPRWLHAMGIPRDWKTKAFWNGAI